ncbi:MAG: ECF transporter S component [Candidatus Asgardarchaeia archaeon]
MLSDTRKLREMAGISVLAAISAILAILPLEYPFPLLQFLKFDPFGVPSALSGILYGPLNGILCCFIVTLVITLRGDPIGAIFKFFAEGSTVFLLALILNFSMKKFNDRKMAVVLSISVSVFVRSVFMSIFNLVFVPIIYSIPVEVVSGWLSLIFFFNVIQGLLTTLGSILVFFRLPRDVIPNLWKKE